jgi:hypothetical protein
MAPSLSSQMPVRHEIQALFWACAGLYNPSIPLKMEWQPPKAVFPGRKRYC